MSCSKRLLLMVLLLIITVGCIAGAVSANPGGQAKVQMSPGAYAHELGASDSIVKLDYPNGAILQNATGDISLNVTLSKVVSSIVIYVPPEFGFQHSGTVSVWTSITNDYSRISIGRQGSRDAIAPGWWRIVVANSTIPVGSHVIRLFDVEAPSVCGRFFVKVFTDGQSIGAENFPTVVVKCDLDPAYISGRVMNGTRGMYAEPVNVSGRVIAEGTTRQGRTIVAQAYFNASANGAYTLYGLAAGTYRLNASANGFTPSVMSERVTVSTGQSLEGFDIYLHPSVTVSGVITSKCTVGPVSWGIVSNSSLGLAARSVTVELSDYSGGLIASVVDKTNPSLSYYHFMLNGSVVLDGHVQQDYADYVSGFALGDYMVNAFVNGYFQKDVVRVHVYDYSREIVIPLDLWRSGSFNVTIHFRYSEGGDLDHVPSGGVLRVGAYRVDGSLGGSYSTRVGAGNSTWSVLVELSGSRGDYGLPSGVYVIQASFPGYVQTMLVQAAIGGGCTVTSLSLDLVRAGSLIIALRSVNWQTPPLGVAWLYPNATVRFELIGSKGGVYSANGRQNSSSTVIFANVTGLPADRYFVRAYTVGYIQAKEYTVVVSLGSMSDMKMDLLTGTRINLILTFRTEGLIAPIDTYPYQWMQTPVRIELYDTHGILVAANATRIPANWTVWTAGFRSYAGNPALRWVNFYDTTDRQLQKDYGLPPGSYLVKVWVPGYMQLETLTVTTTPGSIVTVPLSFEKLSRVYGIISGFNMYGDLIPLSWATITAYGPMMVATSSLDGFYQMWLPNGKYTLAAASPGYETQGAEIHVSMAWELPADFDLKSPSGTIPELSIAELTLPVVLIVVCLSLYRAKSLGNSSRRVTRCEG